VRLAEIALRMFCLFLELGAVGLRLTVANELNNRRHRLGPASSCVEVKMLYANMFTGPDSARFNGLSSGKLMFARCFTSEELLAN
jgi:hypothetical protein